MKYSTLNDIKRFLPVLKFSQLRHSLQMRAFHLFKIYGLLFSGRKFFKITLDRKCIVIWHFGLPTFAENFNRIFK
jgi:hypothetical protein